jgi:hypothetical protein
MALQKLLFRPGVNRDSTNYNNEGGWYECDKIRFVSGSAEKIGGWAKYTFEELIGVCRQIFGWVTSFQDNLLALGTNQKVYIEAGGNLFDITPIRDTTGAGDVTFTAANGSSIITIADTGHGAQEGDFVTFSDALTLSGSITAGTIAGTSTGSATFTTVSQDSTSGDGYGADFTISSDGAGAYTLDAITAAGNAYAAADTLVILGTDLGGSSPANDATITVTTVTSGNITAAILNQNYEIATTVNADAYTITAKDLSGNPVTATADDDGDGGPSTVGAYEVTSGFGVITYGYGWGTDTWGRSGWGSGSTEPINLPLTTWFFDNFDNDLIMNQNTGGKGAPFYWERGASTNPATALGTRAVLLSSLAGASAVPTEVGQILVSQTDKHVLALGATPFGGGTFDPLLIRWSDQDDVVDWTPTLINSAGFLRVSSGSFIVRGFRTRQETLIFTDASIHSLQYLGTTDVFGIQEIETNTSIAGPRAVTTVNNVVFWMGVDKFYMYNGRVDTLPTTLRNHVFNNINFEALTYVYAGTNQAFNEIWWFYPTANSNVNNAYVVYNYKESIWYYGSINRSAWLDSNLRQFPQAIGGSYIYNHESGNDDDGAPLASFLTSSDFDIEDGEQFMLIRRIIPDVDFTRSNANEPRVTMTIKPRNFPGSAYRSDESQNVIETSVGVYTDQVFIRARARQMGFEISSEDLGVAWGLGAPRLDARPDGRR